MIHFNAFLRGYHPSVILKDGRPRWYDTECRAKRAEAIKAGEHVTTKDEENILLQSFREYGAIKQKKQWMYQQTCIHKIEKTFKTNRLNIWKVLNELSPRRNNTNIVINNESFRHFKGMPQHEYSHNFDYDYELESDSVPEKYLNRYSTEYML